MPDAPARLHHRESLWSLSLACPTRSCIPADPNVSNMAVRQKEKFMSEENTEKTDKDQNFEKLRQKVEALEARNAELEPLAVAKLVAEAGFAPDTPAGKALARLASSDSDVDAVRNLAEELGFEAATEDKAPVLSKEERAAQHFADKAADLQSVSTSDEPQDIDSQIADLEASLRQARAAQKWDDVRTIGNQLMQLNTQKMRLSVATHV